jgi:hypothetical protein
MAMITDNIAHHGRFGNDRDNYFLPQFESCTSAVNLLKNYLKKLIMMGKLFFNPSNYHNHCASRGITHKNF